MMGIMSTHVAILLALIASVGFAVSVVFQKKTAIKLPKLTFPPRGRDILAFLKNWGWMAAFGLSVISWLCYMVAMAFAPVSIIQPLIGFSLCILALFAVVYLKERLTGGEWIGIAVTVGGIVLLGASAETKEAGDFQTLSAIRLILFNGLLLALPVVAWLVEKARPGTFNIELILGTISGLLLGVAAILSRVMGLAFRAEAFILFGLLTGLVVALNLISVGLQQGGFQRGRAMTINAILTVLNKVVAVIGGLFAMGEALPADPLMKGLRLAGLAGLLVGSALLSAFNEGKQDKPAAEPVVS
jgi:drug/metabolite transporter (DMT)-like permease